MTLQTITTLAKKIRCFGIASNLESRLAEAKASQSTQEEFIQKLFQDEVDNRREIATMRMLSKAKFRHAYSLEEWDTSYDRGISKAKLKELSLLTFFNNRENLIILGSTGSGKSHMAVALGRRLCSQETSVKFYPTNFFFEEVAAQRAAGRYLVFIKSLIKIETLILDDFGLRNFTHEEATTLMDLLEDRYQKGTLIITSQVQPEGWKSLFEDPVVADAIKDRLVNPSQIILLKGDSYRTKLNKGEKKVVKATMQG